jgi:hypothetical protein
MAQAIGADDGSHGSREQAVGSATIRSIASPWKAARRARSGSFLDKHRRLYEGIVK